MRPWTHASDFMTWGYLLRTTSTGNIIWDRYYTAPPPHYGGRVEFKSLIEATPVGAASTGDIVTVGLSDILGPPLPTPPKGVEAVAMRVDGNTGGFTTPLHSFGAYGGNDLEDFWGVIEHSGDIDGAGVPDLIFVGKATFQTGPTTFTSDVYVVNCPGSPCAAPNAEAIYGDGALGGDWDQAHSVFEASGIGPLNFGDVVMTGFTIPNGNLDWDVILLGVPAALNAGPTLSRKFGSPADQDDAGNSLWEIASGGWLVAGATSSDLRNATADPGDMYLLGTNGNGQTGGGASGDCGFSWSAIRNAIAYGADCYTVTPTQLDLSVPSDADELGPLDPISVCPRPSFSPKPASADRPRLRSAVDAHAVPNPVRRGMEVSLGSMPLSGMGVSIKVANARGEVVFQAVHFAPGTREVLTLQTTDLASGVYSVIVADGEHVELRRFTVVE